VFSSDTEVVQLYAACERQRTRRQVVLSPLCYLGLARSEEVCNFCMEQVNIADNRYSFALSTVSGNYVSK
jgi:hypothetical protein